jgi:DHA1 family tetracycline resistance protein-like MFS transporter
MPDRKKLLTVFIIVFIDLLGFGLIFPLVTFFPETFGAGPALIGVLLASYPAAQMIGAPILGRLSDRYGRRPVLLVSIFGTFVSLLILGFADTLWLLFASRILDGLTGGNISVAQAYITDVTDEKNRARGLGLIGAAFGLGFILGPALGGALSDYGFAVPAFFAAGLAFLNLVAVYLWLPESLTEEKRAELARHPQPALSLGSLREALTRPRVGPLLNIRLFYGLAFAVFQTMFALYALYRLGLGAKETGYVLAYVGLLVVLVQGVAIGWMAARFRDRYLILGGSILMTFSLLAWALAPNLLALLVLLAPLALAAGTLNTVLNSSLTRSVYPEEVGGTLGLSTSLESLTRVIGPLLGGVLLDPSRTWAPGVFATLIMVGVVWFIWRRLIVNPDPPLPDREAATPAGAG